MIMLEIAMEEALGKFEGNNLYAGDEIMGLVIESLTATCVS